MYFIKLSVADSEIASCMEICSFDQLCFFILTYDLSNFCRPYMNFDLIIEKINVCTFE